MEQEIQRVDEPEDVEGQQIGSGDNYEQEEEFNTNKRDVGRQVNKWYLLLLVSIGFVFLIRFFLSNGIPLYPSFLLLIGYRLISIPKNMILWIRSQDNHFKLLYQKELIIDVLMLLFYVSLLICSLVPAAKLVFCSIPLGLCISYYKCFKVDSYNKIKGISDGLEYAFNIFTLATLLPVGLKENNTISWTWYSVFTPVWITVLLLIVICFIQVQVCVRIIKRSFSGESCSGLILSFFYFLATAGFAGCLMYLFMSLSLELDDKVFEKTKKGLMILSSYQIVLLSISFFLHNHIKALLHSKFYPDDFAETVMLNGVQINSQEYYEVEDYPKKMKKISSTYFVPAEESYDIILEIEEQSIDGCRTCIICCAVEPNSIFMNCGHSGACFECAIDVWKKTKNCMICSGQIELLLKFEGIEDGFATVVKAVKYLSK